MRNVRNVRKDRQAWGVRNKRRALTRLTIALLAATGFALSGPGTARATTTVDLPAPTVDGVSATVKFYNTVVPKPYNPDPTAAFGDRKCVNDPGLKSRACTAGATGCGAALASGPALGFRGWVWGG
ncbi:hypothetical protein M2271_008415 [Streptomyces sp. LBL]|nr:hypothetical protein [Streptomyces sp. LBL]